MSALILGLGCLFGLGVTVIARALRPRPQTTPSLGGQIRAAATRLQLPRPGRVALVGGVAVVVLLLTGWPVLAIAAAAATRWFVGGDTKAQLASIERTDAIAAWAEMLSDATGTARGIEGVLVATAPSAPEPIRPEVVRFAQRLAYEPLEDALPDLADDLGDPNGDLVVAAFRLAAGSGGRDLRSVLDDVAVAARDEARMHRRVEVSRERPRSEMRQVIIAIVVVIVLLTLGPSRDYLTPYSSLGGQLVMCVAAAFWIGGLATMARLAQVPRPRRILTHTEQAP